VLEHRWFISLAWVVDFTLPWIEFVPRTGVLAPGGSQEVTVSIDEYRCGVDYAESLLIDMSPVPPGQSPLRIHVSLLPRPRPRGDVDWDCRAGADDAVRILESLLGSFFSTEAESAGADANGDGRIDVADVVRLAGDLLEGGATGPEKKGNLDLSLGGESYRLKVYAIGSWRYRVHLDGVAVGAMMREEGTHAARLVIDDRVRRIHYDINDRGLRLEVDGHPLRFSSQTAGQVRAGSPAVVVTLHVEVGASVSAGQSLGLLEAMKMEIGFQAPVAGTVKEILVHKGQQVAAGDVILVIEEAADDAGSPRDRVRIGLPVQADPLASLFLPEKGERPLGARISSPPTTRISPSAASRSTRPAKRSAACCSATT
jgi:biotin carboxyl carrier protein